MDSLSNRVDYLEKICRKVENPSKKHKVYNSTKPNNISSSVLNASNIQSKNITEKPAKAENKTSEKEKQKKEETEKEETKTDVENKQKEKTEKVQQEKEKENARASNFNENVEATAEKKHLKSDTENDTSTNPPPKKVYRDPATATLRSMIDVRAKLKIAELDLMDRVRQAKEGTMKNLKR